MNSTTAISPFAALIEAAEEREAADRLQKEQARARKTVVAPAPAPVDLVTLARQFGHNFIGKVASFTATQAEKRKWSADYIMMIEAFAEALLSLKDVDLPKGVAGYHVDVIFERFERTLEQFRAIPDDRFYGQRLLAARMQAAADAQTVAETRQPRLRIERKGGPAKVSAPTPANVVPIRSGATTPKGTPGGRPPVESAS